MECREVNHIKERVRLEGLHTVWAIISWHTRTKPLIRVQLQKLLNEILCSARNCIWNTIGTRSNLVKGFGLRGAFEGCLSGKELVNYDAERP